MSGYGVEHGTAEPGNDSQGSNENRPRRPDLSSFFSNLREITPEAETERTRPHAVPVPGDVSAVFAQLAEAFANMRRDFGDNEENGLLNEMIQQLINGVESPPREIRGVSEEFCDTLERVDNTTLTEEDVCPICAVAFLDDKFPLVVRLPCHKTHIFDLACVAPWLRVEGTCPLDRTNFVQQQRERQAELQRIAEEYDEEEDELDGMYA